MKAQFVSIDGFSGIPCTRSTLTHRHFTLTGPVFVSVCGPFIPHKYVSDPFLILTKPTEPPQDVQKCESQSQPHNLDLTSRNRYSHWWYDLTGNITNEAFNHLSRPFTRSMPETFYQFSELVLLPSSSSLFLAGCKKFYIWVIWLRII